jgi:CDP-diacylglycerol--glycerol-3-phosphate 3-phosphatidyltransferase
MPHRRIWTFSNGLTMARVAFVPLFVWVAVHDGSWWQFAAMVVFLLASITDHYDGKLARLRDEITDFGTLADPIADKALTGSAFIIFSATGAFPWWATILMLVREWGITWWRLRIRNRTVHAANYGGKLKTTLQITGIAIMFWPEEAFLGFLVHPVALAVMWAAFAVTMYTGVVYVREFRNA